MSIGYACLTVGVANTNMKTCRIGNATNERLYELISHNLQALETIIDYNINNNIKLYRISSDIIPFGSSPVNKLNWTDLFSDKFEMISKKVKSSGMRVSMHPGQYTVLNSPKKEVVDRAMEDLNYHAKLLQAIGGDYTSKIVIHIGGVYNDKAKAVERFVLNYNRLDQDIDFTKRYICCNFLLASLNGVHSKNSTSSFVHIAHNISCVIIRNYNLNSYNRL